MHTASPTVGLDGSQSLSLLAQAGAAASNDQATQRSIKSSDGLPKPMQNLPKPSQETPGKRDDCGLHRVREVRAQQGLSLRTVARRTGVDVKELRRQEDPATDLTLTELRRWQKALEVPLVDLLEDESQSLSRPVNERAKMVRIMKTVVSLSEACASNVRTARLTTMLREQLLELMPELAEIGGWPQCGSRRGPDVMGRIFHQPISAVDSNE